MGICKSCRASRLAPYAKEYREKTKDQRRLNKRAWDEKNRDKVRADSAAWYAANRESVAAYNKKWMAENKGRRRASYERWRSANMHVVSENAMRHYASKIGATPAWADKPAILRLYLKAREWGFAVDHIVPLRSKLVCGLHVPANLQLLTKQENSAKSNRTWPDMPE